MDVVEDNYLIENPEWDLKMLKSTCIILGWLVTYYFNSTDPCAFIGAKDGGAGSIIDVVDKNTAISKGELLFTTWPEIRKPMKWGPKMGKCMHYSVLVGSRVAEELAKEDLEHNIITECNKPDSVSKLCTPPIELLDVLETKEMEDQAIYVQKNLKAWCAALIKFIRDAKE